jgi:hypothetical protein
MTFTGRSGRRLIAAALATATCLALPLAAGATTGIEKSVPVKVVLTPKGVVWTPSLRTLRPDTDTTFELKVINRTSQPHSFRIGYRETKLLPVGESQFMFYSFHLIGKTPWQARHGKVQAPGFKGTIDVKLRKSFSGGEAG